MNKVKKISSVLFLCGILLYSLQGQTQTVTKELRKVRDAYLASPQLSFDVSAYSYKTKTDKTPELISSGHMKKMKDKYYSVFLNYMFLVNKDKAVIIDKTEKTMDYYEYGFQKRSAPQNFEINIDSLILGSDSVIMQPVKNGIKQFTVFDLNDDILQTELYVDEKTNFIKRILYYYAPSNEDFEVEMDRVEIYYKNITTAAIPESFFNLEKYLKKLNGAYYGINEFKGFKVNYYNSKS